VTFDVGLYSFLVTQRRQPKSNDTVNIRLTDNEEKSIQSNLSYNRFNVVVSTFCLKCNVACIYFFYFKGMNDFGSNFSVVL